MTKEIKQAPRPQNMSQLDYLWTYYGPYSVAEAVSTPPSTDKILTEAAVVDYINSIAGTSAVADLVITQKSGIDFKDKLELRGLDKDGNIVTFVDIDKDTKVIDFSKNVATQEDIDKGNASTLGETVIKLQDSTGTTFYISLGEFQYKGQETDSIITTINKSKIASQIKLNNPIVDPTVEIKSTPDGLRADLLINTASNSKVQIVKTSTGIKCMYVWEGTEKPIGFRSLSHNEYLLITPDAGTVYFIVDIPCIYFMGIKYAAKQSLDDYFTKEEVNTLLKDKIPWVKFDKDGTTVNTIVLDNFANLHGWNKDKTSTYNLAMVSKWDVADFGSKEIPINLNGSKERPTYNDNKEIALVEDIDNILIWTEVN